VPARRRRAKTPATPRTPPSRVNRGKIVEGLRQAGRRGDRAALALAVDQMRTLALSPKYWERYLALLRNPMARLVDLLVIKQGERIAHLKGWKLPRPVPPEERPRKAAPPRRRRPPAGADAQPSLFDLG
jgi:hypothetical protein